MLLVYYISYSFGNGHYVIVVYEITLFYIKKVNSIQLLVVYQSFLVFFPSFSHFLCSLDLSREKTLTFFFCYSHISYGISISDKTSTSFETGSILRCRSHKCFTSIISANRNSEIASLTNSSSQEAPFTPYFGSILACRIPCVV